MDYISTSPTAFTSKALETHTLKSSVAIVPFVGERDQFLPERVFPFALPDADFDHDPFLHFLLKGFVQRLHRLLRPLLIDAHLAETVDDAVEEEEVERKKWGGVES